MLDLLFILLTQLINETNFTIDFQVIGEGRRLLPELRPGRTRFVKESRILRRLGEYSPDPYWKIRVLIDGEFTGIELDPQILIRFVRVVFRVDGVGSDTVLCVGRIQENCNDYFLRCRFFGCMRNIFWDGRDVESIDRSDSKLATKLRHLEGDRCEGLAPFVDKKRYASPLEKGRKGSDRPIPPTVNNYRTKSPPPSPKVAAPQKRPSNDSQPPMRSRDQATTFDDHENGTNTLLHINRTNAIGQERPRRDGPRPLEGFGWQKSSVDSEDSTIKDSFVHGLLFVLALVVCILLKCSLLM